MTLTPDEKTLILSVLTQLSFRPGQSEQMAAVERIIAKLQGVDSKTNQQPTGVVKED